MRALQWKKSLAAAMAFYHPKAERIPTDVDLRQYCTPVEDQGQLGSCTANAIVGMLEWMENKNRDTNVVRLSRLFVYFNERNIEGDIAEDAGAFIHDGINSLATLGICEESVWPYKENMFAVKPSAAAYDEALHHRYHNYHQLNGSKASLIGCLAEGYPFVFGVPVSEHKFCVDLPGGIVPMITGRERDLGGHAMCCVGYDLIRDVFIVRNSWGPDWGDNGYCYFPMDYLTKFGDDFWTVRGTYSNN